MSSFLRKAILFWCCSVRISLPTSNLGFVGNPNVISLRCFSHDSNQQSFTFNYLINELGFTPKTALKVSKLVNFRTPEKPEKVINLFKKYGFTQTQISSLARRKPALLVKDPEKVVSPKLEFFDAKGVSWPQFARKLTAFPTVLGSSLGKQILPSYEFIRNFLQSDEKAIATVQKYPNILIVNVEKCLAPNIDIMREQGVPDSNIAKLIPSQPEAFTFSSDQLRKIVEDVVEMGFDAKSLNFVLAVVVFRGLSKSTWESKINAYKRCGWSEEDFFNAFHKFPWCMKLSENKIMDGMSFFIGKMGLRPCVIAKNPMILSLSLNKRVIPRFSVFQTLLSKGLVKKEVSLRQLFMETENKFLQKFVLPHEKEAPELLKLYEEKLNHSNRSKVDDEVC